MLPAVVVRLPGRGSAPAAAADRAAEGIGYVALGDSYSAGVGGVPAV
ncbi:hypothetical protein QCN29_16135 [Streptomyces sp. HNM0663]|uniref:SGNH/GDSL hydrolase family protein n=1 Tax=Streptomyces chengmaiensis TaxID=3040919 RepID=A0ABT6HPP0_9ACTN|nr:hypothetical protein [Streptomyces chengmaiensis]MDH2390295.1 hypothetical protein [Streptomyces chengmaiensis]